MNKETKDSKERPMMIDTWTQTSNIDLGTNDGLSPSYIVEARERESGLLQKICELEKIVREQSERILIQANIICRQFKKQNMKSGYDRQQVPAIIVYHTSLQRRHFPYSLPIVKTYNEQSCSTSTNGCSRIPEQQNSIQERLQQNNSHQTNYKIIAEGGQEESIEIELSEEISEMSSNCSTECDMLEICLSDPKQTETNENNINCEPKDEINQTNQPSGGLETPSIISTTFELDKRTQSTSQSLSPEECLPSTSKHSRALLAKNSNFPTKLNKIKKERKSKSPKIAKIVPTRRNDVEIGLNKTVIDANVYDKIPWKSPSLATRKLMSAIFSREMLATHSLTGQKSPAFKYKPVKAMLDQIKLQDIIHVVKTKCKVDDKEVRHTITSKCADENKMWRLAQEKLAKKNKENAP